MSRMWQGYVCILCEAKMKPEFKIISVSLLVLLIFIVKIATDPPIKKDHNHSIRIEDHQHDSSKFRTEISDTTRYENAIFDMNVPAFFPLPFRLKATSPYYNQKRQK